MSSTRRLWLGLGALLVISFGVLLWAGGQIFRAAPPIPDRVVSDSGQVVYTKSDIEKGRQVWQSMGGMQLGSIWGHGGYVAPDWSADWLHRESVGVLDLWARAEDAANYAALPAERQAALRGRLKELMRTNTYDAGSGTITLPQDRVAALSNVVAHYESLFGNDPATAELREAYAMKNDTVPDAENRRALTAFFWWTAWAAGTERPREPGDAMVPSDSGVVDKQVTYTNNWPSEPLIDNTPPPSMWVWSAFSVLFLIAGIGLLGWYHARTNGEEGPVKLPASDPLAALRITLLQDRAELAFLLRDPAQAQQLATQAVDLGSTTGPLCRRHWETRLQAALLRANDRVIRRGESEAQATARVGAAAAEVRDARTRREACTIAAPNRF